MKIFSIIGVVLMVCSVMAAPVIAQDAEVKSDNDEMMVIGVITEIAPDGAYIVVDETKIVTTPDMIDEAYFELNDRVEIIARETDKGLELVDYEYLFNMDDEY